MNAQFYLYNHFRYWFLQATLTALEFVPMEEDIIVLTFSVFAFICNGNSNACIKLFISFYLFGYIFGFILKEIRPRTPKLAPSICLNIVEYVTESSNSANGFMLISCLKFIMTSFSNWILIYDVINSVIMTEIQLLC